MIGALVAAAVVALVQLVRCRDPRMLVLAALLVLQAAALFLERGSLWSDVAQAGVCLAGIALALLLPAPRAPQG